VWLVTTYEMKSAVLHVRGRTDMHTGLRQANLEERDHLQELGAHERRILK